MTEGKRSGLPSRGAWVLLIATFLPLLVGAAAPPPTAGDAGPISRQGTYEGGQYVIEVPAGWNGGLVLYAHGIDGSLASPLSLHLRERGYALAASSYRTLGYRVDLFIDDMRALLDLFIREVRRPRWAVIHGQSMGGHVAIASLELYPGLYQGALIECGNVDGVGIADFYAAARAAAEYLGAVNLFDAPDRETIVRRVNGQWLPLMGAPPAYTERGRRFDSVLKYLMGGDLPLRLQGLPRYYFRYLAPSSGAGDQELVRSASTVQVRYRIDSGLGVAEDDLNAGVRRISPPAGARSRSVNPAFAELTGRITVPVLTLHNTGDGWVPFGLQQSYRRRTLAAGTDHLLVQRAVRWPGHCVFDGETREQAFDDLIAWMERGTRPMGDDVLASDLSTLGLRWTRILHPEDPAQRPDPSRK
jgi:pimeloyl-ACP methyl ester carboxylesterase